MQNEVSDFIRSQLKEKVLLLTDVQISVFKRCFSHKDLLKDINIVIDEMPNDKLDNALRLVNNTIK